MIRIKSNIYSRESNWTSQKKKNLCLGPTRAREEAHGTTGPSRSLTRAHAQAQHSTQRYGRRPDRPRGGSQWSPATSCFFPFFLVVYSFIFFSFYFLLYVLDRGGTWMLPRLQEREKKKRLRPWNKRLNLVRDRGVKQALMEP